MIDVITHLEEKRAAIQLLLKDGKKEFLPQLQAYDKAILWLKKIEELQLANVQKYNVVKLPNPNTGYSEYRIMNDCETDDISQWIELEHNGTRVSAAIDDVLILSKP